MRFATILLGTILFTIAAATSIGAQSPTPKDPYHPDTPSASSPTTPREHGGAPAGMMSMDMCRQMMAGHMMGGMGMPMGGDAQKMDPKTTAQMLEMRGEMMKAMGDIMMKHAKKMQGAPR